MIRVQTGKHGVPNKHKEHLKGTAKVTVLPHNLIACFHCGRFLSCLSGLVINLEHPKEQNSYGAIKASVSSLT